MVKVNSYLTTSRVNDGEMAKQGNQKRVTGWNKKKKWGELPLSSSASISCWFTFIFTLVFLCQFKPPSPTRTPTRPLLTSLTCTPTYVGYLFTLLGYKASLFPFLHQTAFSLSQYLLRNMHGEPIPSFLSCWFHRFSSALLQFSSFQSPFRLSYWRAIGAHFLIPARRTEITPVLERQQWYFMIAIQNSSGLISLKVFGWTIPSHRLILINWFRRNKSES